MASPVHQAWMTTMIRFCAANSMQSCDINPCPQVWNDTKLEEASTLEKLQCVSLFLENIKRLLTRFSTLPKWCWHSVHHICSWITYHSTTFFSTCFPHVNLLPWGSWVTICPKGIHCLTTCYCEVLSMPPRKVCSKPFKVGPPRGIKKVPEGQGYCITDQGTISTQHEVTPSNHLMWVL